MMRKERGFMMGNSIRGDIRDSGDWVRFTLYGEDWEARTEKDSCKRGD